LQYSSISTWAKLIVHLSLRVERSVGKHMSYRTRSANARAGIASLRMSSGHASLTQ